MSKIESLTFKEKQELKCSICKEGCITFENEHKSLFRYYDQIYHKDCLCDELIDEIEKLQISLNKLKENKND
jgi:hypothetical protein